MTSTTDLHVDTGAAATMRSAAGKWINNHLAPSLSAAMWGQGVRMGLAILLLALVWGGCGFAYATLAAETALPGGHPPGAVVLITAVPLLTTLAVFFFLQRRYRELLHANATIALTRIDLLTVLGKLTELRDRDTAGHNLRVTLYTLLFAQALKLPPRSILWATVGAMIHDIGKLAVPDSILGKKGSFTPEERAEMETHVLHGVALVNQSEMLNQAATVLIAHHERYDGTGYPRGLKGEEIPFEARLFALIDVFDAMTSVRVYKPALSLDEALAVMAEGRGSHFDPVLFDQFWDFAHRVIHQLPRDEAGVMEMLMLRFYPYLDRFALEDSPGEWEISVVS
jgi:HD-GYP domain-containing protein (c-di-GMP phosphodiesterase class II)